uniref:DNA polymerase III subunit epsilon n=1 Tax=Candidatus Kentrum sp. TUN TaxID=2126343 RepID=A0A450ZQU5_9GAMM|nr:MAG: DNA polymerase-3 subunit epsilon [Candidatus Kentron sp. TUN]VFK56199.1 MAG: DNA polymerase-3 subunit epsilon [Candidatus Kentron sp. TUN]VFK62438.1 MAG: DNA polymerase-3 subunit epsilon [Candidatus Kentron sp. TUN]
MRQITLDTETTGLDTVQGHRIIEIGARELQNRRLTEQRFHHYLQPDREIDTGAQAVHGITTEFLQDKPRFADIAKDFIAFIEGAEVIIHNAPFDRGFIDYELSLLGPQWKRIEDYCTIVDTLVLARTRHPGQKNNLDALCRRYNVDNSQRDLHGALLDAEILANVYLAMTGGQTSLALEATPTISTNRTNPIATKRKQTVSFRVIRADAEELAEHAKRLMAIDQASGGKCIWKQFDTSWQESR